MKEIEFLKHLNHKLSECGLKNTYLNDIVECRLLVKERLELIKNRSVSDVRKSFTISFIVNELEDCDHLDDAIIRFKEQL